MRLAVVTTLRSITNVVRLAEAAETAGFWGMGVSDTAPKLYQAMYPTVTASLQATRTLHVGPYVTNPVTRHWSIHASSARTFEEFAPARFFLGLGTGDGAVHSVGLKPATWQQVEETVDAVRAYAPADLDIQVAASGPKGCETAGRIATDLILGTGLDTEALRRLGDRARGARQAAGVATPLRVWAFASVCLVEDEADVPAARREVRALANGGARFAFASTFEDKHIPEEWRSTLRERLAGYDFGAHVKGGAESPNSLLFEGHPEVQDYLVDRMVLVGTPAQVRERVARLEAETGVAGLWLLLTPNGLNPDVLEHFGHVAGAVSPWCTGS